MENITENPLHFPSNDQHKKILNTILHETDKGILYTNNKNEILYINNQFTEITGYTFKDVAGKTPKILQSGIQDPTFYEDMKAAVNKHSRWTGHLWNRTKEGEIYLQKLSIFALKNESGHIENFLGFISKIHSDEKTKEDPLLNIQYYDPLTNLPNRILFKKRLHSSLNIEGKKIHNIAIIFLKIKEFEDIIDQYGFLFGNILLKRIVSRIRQEIPTDGMLARWDDSTFAFIIENISHKETEVSQLIKLFSELFKYPFLINDQSILVTPYFGISVNKRGVLSLSDYLNRANKALNHAIEHDELYSFYKEGMDVHNELIIMESDLIQALENKQFTLYYQPLFIAETNKLVGFEALIRWNHPREGVISPNQFIPLAEKTGLIHKIGEYVFRKACNQQVQWRQQGKTQLTISVNLSMVQFEDDALIESMKQILEETKANPKKIVIELTETSLAENIENTITKLKKLQELGLKIAVDDFGTGYSSLGHLIHFPIHIIKIDRSFIKVLDKNKKIKSIVKAINTMAKAMNIKVVAEGVETERQLQLVKKLNCNLVQGYLFDRPLTVQSVQKKWLA